MKRTLLLVAIFVCIVIPAFAQGDTMGGPSAKPATTAKKPPVFRPTKDQISKVQKILIDKKLYTGEADGKYNDATRAGIKSFQKDNGLKETGTLNRATLEKFGVELTDTQKAIPVSQSSFATPADKTTAKTSTKSSNKTIFRATSDQIKAAQKLMKSKLFYAGDETGKLDDATRAGLKKYQEANGLNVTGTLNQVTLDKMGIALTDKQKADAAQTKK